VARPSKGAGARTQVVCVRLTTQEAGALGARFGSAGKALRVLVTEALEQEPSHKKRGGVVKGRVAPVVEEGSPSYVLPVKAMRNPQEVAALETPLIVGEAGPEAVTPRHRHRRGAVIRVDYEFGNPKQVYGCLECGEELA
jgi:hypothetical protein